jgi:hypothetical protein
MQMPVMAKDVFIGRLSRLGPAAVKSLSPWRTSFPLRHAVGKILLNMSIQTKPGNGRECPTPSRFGRIR